jgi:type II restriction enzyme
MNKISKILQMNDNDTFQYFSSTLKDKITKWEYFVNWKKVLSNVDPIEHELNLMNSLIGKTDLYTEAKKLFRKYPSVIKAIPALLAVRDKSVKVLVDVNNFIYNNFDFSVAEPDESEIEGIVAFIQSSGLGNLIANKRIKNFVDYLIGGGSWIRQQWKKKQRWLINGIITPIARIF